MVSKPWWFVPGLSLVLPPRVRSLPARTCGRCPCCCVWEALSPWWGAEACDPHSQRLWRSQWSKVYVLEFPCFFYDPVDVGSFISGFSAFSKSSLYIWKFLIHTLLKPSLKDFEHYLASMWDEHNCVVIWTCFGSAFLWDWSGKLTFSSPVATAEFSKFVNMLSAALQQHHLLGFEIAQLKFHHLH